MVQPIIGDYNSFKSHPKIPLWILSASLRLHNDYDVRIVDIRTDRNWRSTIVDELSKQPILAGVSCMVGKPIEYALEISAVIKKHSDVPVV